MDYKEQETKGDEEEEEEDEEALSWKTKPLRGMYNWQTEKVAGIKKLYQWLEKFGLKNTT